MVVLRRKSAVAMKPLLGRGSGLGQRAVGQFYGK